MFYSHQKNHEKKSLLLPTKKGYLIILKNIKITLSNTDFIIFILKYNQENHKLRILFLKNMPSKNNF